MGIREHKTLRAPRHRRCDGQASLRKSSGIQARDLEESYAIQNFIILFLFYFAVALFSPYLFICLFVVIFHFTQYR